MNRSAHMSRIVRTQQIIEARIHKSHMYVYLPPDLEALYAKKMTKPDSEAPLDIWFGCHFRLWGLVFNEGRGTYYAPSSTFA